MKKNKKTPEGIYLYYYIENEGGGILKKIKF